MREKRGTPERKLFYVAGLKKKLNEKDGRSLQDILRK